MDGVCLIKNEIRMAFQKTSEQDVENINLNKKMLKPLDEMLHCRICLNYFNYCVMTACCHNFCSVCIRKRMVTDADCPICFEDVKETDLRNNKLIDKITRIYKKLRLQNNENSKPPTQVLNSSVGTDYSQNNSEQNSSVICKTPHSTELSSPVKIEVTYDDEPQDDTTNRNNYSSVGINNEESKTSLPSPLLEPGIILSVSNSRPETYKADLHSEMNTTNSADISTTSETHTEAPCMVTPIVSNEACRTAPTHEMLLIIPNKTEENTNENFMISNESCILSQSTPVISSDMVCESILPDMGIISSTPKRYNTSVKSTSYPQILTEESFPREWYLTFAIPWDKMPSDLMSLLEAGERPSMKLRRQMVRIICSKVRVFHKKPGKQILDVVARKAFERYPESLCDNPSDPALLCNYSALTKQLVCRMENLNRKSQFFGNSFCASANVCHSIVENTELSAEFDQSLFSSETSNDDEAVSNLRRQIFQPGNIGDSSTSTSSTPNSTCNDSKWGISISSPYGDNTHELSTSSNLLSELAQSKMDLDVTQGVESKVSPSQLGSTAEWYESFTIPWHEMPSPLMRVLEEKKRPSSLLRRTMIRTICNKIRRYDSRPRRRILNIIAKKAFEKYPESLCDDFNGSLLLNKYNCLVLQLSNRLANLCAKKYSASNLMDPFTASGRIFTNIKIHSARSVNFASHQRTAKPLSWYEKFEIPWEEMPDKLMHILKEGQRPDMLSRRIMIRIICEKIRKFELKPGWKIVDVIARKAFEAYPKSLCDDPDTQVSKYSYRTLRTQLQNRLLNYFRVKVSMVDIGKELTSQNISTEEKFKNFHLFGKSGKCKEILNNSTQFNQLAESEEGFNGSTQFSELSRNVESSNDTTQCDKLVKMECMLSSTSNTFESPVHSDLVNVSNDSIVCNSQQPFLSMNVTDSESQPVIFTSDWADNFVIPWHKMPDDLLETLRKKRRPDRMMRSDMVRVICDEIRVITKHPGKKILARIAKRVYEAYPESLCDNFYGEVVGNGYTSLINQLMYKIDNQNRSDRFKGIESDEKSFSSVNHHGCINWNPGELPEHETKESQQQKKGELELISAFSPTVLDARTIKLLDDTFYSQRKDVINAAGIEGILKDWPLLFTIDGLLNHFKVLVGFNSLEKFNTSLLTKANTIFYYLLSISSHINRKTLQLVFQELERMDDLDKVESPAVIMFLIMAYFNERRQDLFLLVDASATRSDVETISDLPKTPCLIICGESVFRGSSFMLCIDGTVVIDKIDSFEKGVVILFSSYYVFNIGYPTTVKATLEFTQRCLFSINPNRNAKVANRKMFDKKVVALIKNLADYHH